CHHKSEFGCLLRVWHRRIGEKGVKGRPKLLLVQIERSDHLRDRVAQRGCLGTRLLAAGFSNPNAEVDDLARYNNIADLYLTPPAGRDPNEDNHCWLELLNHICCSAA